MPFELRLALIFLLGALAGSFANLAIRLFAWEPQALSLWCSPPKKAAPRRWFDRIPVIGWVTLRREENFHPAGFWVRPMLIELGLGILFAWLYWWEVGHGQLYPSLLVPPTEHVHWQFAAHAVLAWLMLVASMIDIDERSIPDQITLTGGLLGLLLATMFPWSLLPQIVSISREFGVPVEVLASLQLKPGVQLHVEFLTLASPHDWPRILADWPRLASLALAVGSFLLWCYAFFFPHPSHFRHGLLKNCKLFPARFRRRIGRLKKEGLPLAVTGLGLVGILIMWGRGGAGWAGLVSALVGLAVSGGIVWAVRLIGGFTLRREAMGFGDVLLMMMIGTFTGWQASLIIFFLAPLAAVVIGVIQLILRRDDAVPYGPFLCLATLAVLILWEPIWGQWAQGIFFIPWLVPAVVGACLVLMLIMLPPIRMVREAIQRRFSADD